MACWAACVATVCLLQVFGLVFHESGSILPAFAKLAQNGKGAAARLSAKHKALMCSKSFPMIRRLFDAVVRPTVSYGCEVWASACSQALGPELKDMLRVQMAFFRQLCHLRKSVTPAIIFREFAERPWLDTGGPSCCASCALCRFYLMTACIFTLSGITLLM